MNLLITGGNGFIGTNFIKMIMETTDHNIINLDKKTYAANYFCDSEYKINERYKNVRIIDDICKVTPDFLESNSIEGIINFAAETHVDNSISNPLVFEETNVRGTLALLEATRIYGRDLRFHQVSTDEVYGSIERGWANESYPLKPNSPYSASKSSAEMFIRAYRETFDLNITITRASNNYGPFQHKEKFIPTIITKAINGEPIPIYGDGNQIREWTFVLDHCLDIWEVFQFADPGEIYNVGDGKELKNIELVQIILKELNKSDSLIKFVTDRLGHDRRYAIDCEKMRHDFYDQYPPKKKDFNKGLKETIEWYINNQNGE